MKKRRRKYTEKFKEEAVFMKKSNPFLN